MAITPVDIVHTQFKTSFKGYNRGQVDEFVRPVTDALEDALREKSELQRRIHALQDDLDRVKKIESAMSDALTLAQKSAGSRSPLTARPGDFAGGQQGAC